MVLGLGGLLLLDEPLGSVLQLSGHLVLIDLDSVLVALDRALILGLHLCRLRLSKLDLLGHEGSVLLKVDILVVQFVLSLIKLALDVREFLAELYPLQLKLFLVLVEGLLLLGHEAPLRLNLVVQGDLGALQLGNLVGKGLVFLDQFASLMVVSLLLLVRLVLMLLGLLLELLDFLS